MKDRKTFFKKKMIVCIPQRISPGAKVILEEYHKNAMDDTMNEYVFILSNIELPSATNIRIFRYNKASINWVHRFIFMNTELRRVVMEEKPDEILNLSNTIVPMVRTKQLLYLQQALPYMELTIQDFMSYKDFLINRIRRMVISHSIKKSDGIIVQTEWLKEACIKKCRVPSSKISVITPKANIHVKKKFDYKNMDIVTFFYPAEAYYYKNHRIVVSALKDYLSKEYQKRVKVIFTITGDENAHVCELKEIVKNNQLPIDFIGRISRAEVMEYYSKSVLIFPSYVESFGIPLLEAKMHESPALVSDSPFSHEIFADYDNVIYFDHRNSIELSKRISEVIENCYRKKGE